QIDVPCISLLHIDIPKKVQRKFTRELAVECQAIPVRIDDAGRLEVAMVDPTDAEILAKIEGAVVMTVTPLIAPESSIIEMIEKFYPAAIDGDDTLSARRHTDPGRQSVASDPIFWDIIEELDSADLDRRLTRIEQTLDRIWILLEKVLRTLEMPERR